MKKNFAAAVVVAVAPAFTFAQGVASEPTISADSAMEAATAALAHCRAEGGKVTVTVVDASGRAKASIRDDGAAPHSAEHSFRKAYTALTYRMPSAEVGRRAAEAKGVAIGPQLLANMTTAAGGVPIKSGNTIIGAIGVSGTPSSRGGGEGDAKCAEAGLARIMRATAAVKGSADESARLLRIDREWAAAAAEGKDAERVASYWSDDAVIVPAGAPIVRGKAAIREFVRSSFAIPGFHIEWRSDEPLLSDDGSVGYMLGESRITVPGADGKLMTMVNRGVSVWKRDASGNWRCVIDIWNGGS